MTPLRVGIIGLGVGERHLASYQTLPDCTVTAICDIDPAKLNDVGDRFGVAARYADYRKITTDPDIDVVSICSYDDAHAEQAISAFRHDKHVMLEKPIALYRRDAELLLREQQDSGRYITSNLILRESPRFREVRDQIKAGEFGEIFAMEGDYLHEILWKITEGWRGRMDFYCTVFGGGIHLIDLMRWLIQQEVTEVAAMGNKILTAGTAYKFDDSFFSLLRFDGGALAKCLTTLGPKRTKFHALSVYGTKRTFVNDMPNAKVFDGDQPEDERPVKTPYPGMKKGDLLPEFIEAIRNGHEPEVSVTDVFRVMDVCFAIHEAAEAGRNVKVSYQI